METTTYNTVVTINRELNELSYSFFSDIVKKSPIKAVELEPGKWAFNDNEIGQGRNYFCDMFGYSLTQEEFEFEYFDDPQTLEDPEASESDKYEFYTQNGWAGSNYDQKLGTKEIAVKVRAFLKKEFPGFKFSVRSKWGMTADTLYITILSGPIQALCEGNPHSFESCISGFGEQYKGLITDEMLSVCDKIHSYVSSYRFSDSDGMIDYFDTNFYCWMNIGELGKPYHVVKPTRPTRPEKKTTDPASYGDTEISPVSNAIEIVDYSEKAIAVFGDTKTVKDQLKSLGGRFNPSLNYNGEKRAGWIFSKKQADKVKELIVPALPEAGQKEVAIKEGDLITFKADSFQDSEVYRGIVEYKEQLGFVVYVNGVQYELRKVLNIKKLDNFPLIIADYAKYDSFDYPTIPEGLDGFKLGEVVYDQCGEIGVILAFNEKNGTARLNSNGCCDVGRLKKCPKEIAEKEVERMDIIRPGKALTACTIEAYPLENIHFTETDNFNGVRYYDIEGAESITSAKVRTDIQPGDVFNVYTDKDRKHGVTYDGVSVESSLKNDLPGIIEFDNKIKVEMLSISSHYKPMVENVEFYEKKVKGKRYTVKDKPLTLGYYGILDNLDNCIIDCYQTKEEAEKEAEILNGFTDGNERLKSVI